LDNICQIKTKVLHFQNPKTFWIYDGEKLVTSFNRGSKREIGVAKEKN